MSLTVYLFPMSQPCRAVHTALLIGEIEFTNKNVNIMKEEHKAPEFTDIFPAHLIPAMTEGDFKLFESNAILRYLATVKPSLRSLYPIDPQQQAQINCYLDWHHLGFRNPITDDFMMDHFFRHHFQNKPAPADREQKLEIIHKNLAFFENFFLGGEKNYQYIANQPNLTIADLTAYSEINTLLLINYDFSKFPQLQIYLEKISQVPQIKEANAIHYGIVKQFNPELNEFNQKLIGL